MLVEYEAQIINIFYLKILKAFNVKPTSKHYCVIIVF